MIDIKLLQTLDDCLNTIVPAEEHLSIDELRGLFYAQMITPAKHDALAWLSAIFKGQHPAISDSQATLLNEATQAVYSAYHELLTTNKLAFPFNFEQLDEELAEIAYSWCLGFFAGLAINEVFWFGKKGEKLKPSDAALESVRNSAKLFSGLATKDFSDFDQNKIKEIKALLMEQGEEPNGDMIAIALFPNVPIAAKTLHIYGVKTMQLAAQHTPIQPAIKIGRNDPCHCGSGKKYKKCCG